jgi:hypothetical protein
MVSRGATDELPTPVFTENTLRSKYKNCFVCLGTNVKRTLSLEDKSWQETIYVRTSSNQLSVFVSEFNQMRDASKILGTNSDMKF